MIRFIVLAALALAPQAALAGGLAEALVGISVRASVEATSRMTTEATLCQSTKETSHETLPPSCRMYFSAALDPATAAQLQREAYDCDGPVLRQVAAALGVDPRRLALALVERAPITPNDGELRHLLAFAAPAFEPG